MTSGPGLEVGVGRVGRSGHRARWAAVLWGAAMVAIVAPSIGQPAGAPGAAPRITPAGPHADPGPAASAAAHSRPIPRVVTPPVRISGEDGLMGSLVLDLKPVRRFVRSWPVGRLPRLTNPAQS